MKLKELIIFSLFIITLTNSHSSNSEIKNEILLRGKEIYELISKRKQNLDYGQCWFDAIKEFEDGCAELTEKIQVQLAIRFANCFFEMTDQSQIQCDATEKENIRRICFQEMNDRAYLTFTEFYTHTQNMCYFVRNQLWHKETEETINMLGIMSNHVVVKLAMAEQQQEQLLEQQRIGLKLQNQIHEQSTHLSQMLQQSRFHLEQLTDEFRTTAFENNQIFIDIFTKIHSLQNWLLGEYSMFNLIVYYIFILILFIILTSSHRTSSSRLTLFMILSINILTEYFIRLLLMDFYQDDLVEYKYKLESVVWITRKFFIVLSLMVCFVNAFRYNDINEKNNRMLSSLIKQNEIITNELNLVRSSVNCMLQTKRRPNRIQIQTIPINHETSYQLERSFMSELSQVDEDSVRENLLMLSRNLTSTPISFNIETPRYNLRKRGNSLLPK